MNHFFQIFQMWEACQPRYCKFDIYLRSRRWRNRPIRKTTRYAGAGAVADGERKHKLIKRDLDAAGYELTLGYRITPNLSGELQWADLQYNGFSTTAGMVAWLAQIHSSLS